MNENELLTNAKRREENMGKVEVLDKVGTLLSLPNTELYTTEMVANYYGVTTDAIKKLTERNIDELSKNGYKVLTGVELSSLKEKCQIKSKSKSIAIFTKRTVLLIGLLLRDSKVADEIKCELGLPTTIKATTRKEMKFKLILDNIIKEIRNELISNIGANKDTKLYEDIECSIMLLSDYIPQYSVCDNSYRIDFYFPVLNLAVEYDENYHNAQIEEDKQREYEIIRDIYISKYYNDVTDKDLKEWKMKNKEELFDCEYEEQCLEYSFDLTRFVRIHQNEELSDSIRLTTIITNMINKEISSRGMSCNYESILNKVEMFA